MSVEQPLVLIVEDTPEFGRLLQITLERYGYRTHHVVNGLQALDFLEMATPDAMLLDIGLPEMSGWGVLEAVKSQYPQTTFPVIMLTAFDDAANRLIGKLQSRVVRYLTKPFNHQLLVSTLSEALHVAPACA